MVLHYSIRYKYSSGATVWYTQASTRQHTAQGRTKHMDTIAIAVTPEEYLALEAQAEYKSEYHDGVIVPMSGAQPTHVLIEGNVFVFFYNTLDDTYTVFNSNAQVRIPATNRYVYPDVTVVAGPPDYDTTAPIAVVLNPLLLVEVLSDSTQGYDRGDKFAHYQTISTFREYLLIDQYRMHVVQWTRSEAHGWQQTVYTDWAEVIALQSVPAALPVAQVYRRIAFE